MTRSVLSCEGLTLGTLRIPPFRVGPGQAICLHMPPPADESQEELLQILTGKTSASEVQRFGQVEWAARPNNDGRVENFSCHVLSFFHRVWFGSPRTLHWLMQSGRVTVDEAQRVLASHAISPHSKICQLACNPRTILALEAAWARGAEVVIFTTVGCDPRGVHLIHDLVTAHLKHCGAINLNFEYVSNDQRGRVCFPSANCLSVDRVVNPALVSASARLEF
jgi:hypothetical protein